MKANSLTLLLILAFSQLFAQETKKELVLTETFTGDTFDNVFTITGKPYTRRTSEFGGLKLTAPSQIVFNKDSLKYRYLKTYGGLYDSLHIEVSATPKFFILNPITPTSIGFKYFGQNHDVYNYSDTNTHVITGRYSGRTGQSELAFMLYDSSVSNYINYIKIYGFRYDSTIVDTGTTGMREDSRLPIKFYSSEGRLIIENSHNKELDISIYDLGGRIMLKEQIKLSKEIQIGSMEGVYTVCIKDEMGEVIIKKIYLQ